MPLETKHIIKADIPGTFKWIDTFETWWNPNCALIISEDNCKHHLFLIVYEPPFRKAEGKLLNKKIIEYYNWDLIKEEAEKTKWELNGERPFLSIFLKNEDNFSSINIFSQFFGEGRITRIDVDDINIPDECIRPLDIVWRKISSITSHVGIYLGINKICHIYSHDGNIGDRLGEMLGGDNSIQLAFNLLRNRLLISASSSSSSQNRTNENLWVKIDNWEEFLDGAKEAFCYHSIIPSKSPKLIINHLKKALRAEYGKGKYSAINKNCEHFANLVIHGINFSKQVSNFFSVSVFENKKIKKNLVEKIDQKIFDKLKSQRELTNEEQKTFEQLEAQIEISFPSLKNGK